MVDKTALDVVSVGEALIDFIAPDAEDLEGANDFIRAPGGAPANVTVAAARLGASSALLGAVGQDAFGSFLRSTLAANGVDIAGIRTLAERTTLAFVARNAGGIPDFVFYRGADAAFGPKHLDQRILARCSFLYASSMALMSPTSRAATMLAIESAHRAGAMVCVDPNLRPSSWPSLEIARETIQPLLDTADILKVNDQEATLFTDSDTPEEALGELGQRRPLVVVTIGGEGCIWYRQGQSGRVPAPRVEVRDTTGAGDAFVGALLQQLAALGKPTDGLCNVTVPDLDAALRFACAAGALSCMKPGAMASLPYRRQVEDLLQENMPAG